MRATAETIELDLAEAAYAHLTSFRTGGKVYVIGQPGKTWDHRAPPQGRRGNRRRLSRETVLAVPQVRVAARWISCSRAASIEM